MSAESARFWAKVDVRDAADCWPWTASKSLNGYGQVSFRGRLERAHRASYILSCGKIAEGLVIDHLCGNRACVNPAHLEAVTQRENIMRGSGPDAVRRMHAAKTHCKRGHPFEGDNLVIRGGRRACRECERAKALAHYYKNHERNKEIGRDRKREAYQPKAERV